MLQKLALKSTKKVAQRLEKSLAVPLDCIEQILDELDIAPELKKVPKNHSQLLGILEGLVRDRAGLVRELTEMGVLRRGL